MRPRTLRYAAHAEVAGQRRRQIGAGLLSLELEVDAGHDVHAAAGDAEVDRRVAPNSNAASTIFKPAVSSCRWKNPPPPKMRDRQQERMRALGDVEVERRPAVEERQRERGAEADVLEREHADGDRRQRERKAGANARRATDPGSGPCRTDPAEWRCAALRRIRDRP